MVDKELNLLEKETNENISNLKLTQWEGLQIILRYYDRIHDKLFFYNNVLIVGYFVLIVLPSINIDALWILLPILNMLHLIKVDYRMMKKSRFESDILNQSQQNISKYGKKIYNPTNQSLLSIILTIFVTLVFVNHLVLLR